MNDEPSVQRENTNDDRFLEAAAQWWVRLRGTRDPAAAAEWLKWSGENTGHADAFERVAELGSQLDALDAAAKEQLIAEFAPRDRPPRRIVRRHLPRFLAAAAAVMAAIALIGGYLAWPQISPVHEKTFTTQIGENRTLVLDDGSKVVLGGASEIEVRYGKHLREIRLQKGEAYFVDTHETERPFVVTVGKLSARAIGTAFDVRRGEGAVLVAVADGRVLVASEDGKAPNGGAVEAKAGQQVVYRPTAAGLRISSIDADNVAAWRQRRLEFIDEPLASVVAQLNRYSQKPLRIDSSSLKTLRVTGTVDLDNLSGWLHALPAIFPIKVTVGRSVIALSSKTGRHKQRQ